MNGRGESFRSPGHSRPGGKFLTIRRISRSAFPFGRSRPIARFPTAPDVANYFAASAFRQTIVRFSPVFPRNTRDAEEAEKEEEE